MFNFPQGPPGVPGLNGGAGTISLGNITATPVPPSSPAIVTVTNTGTPNAAVLNFAFQIPQGLMGATGATGPTGPTGAAGPLGPSNFQVFIVDGNFVVPSGVNTIQIEAVGAGGPGSLVAGAYEKVVLSVVSGSTYAMTVGVSGGQTNTLVKDQTGTLVACGAGGEAAVGNGPGLGGTRIHFCPN